MNNLSLLRTVTFGLARLLPLLLIISCQTVRSIALSEADTKELIVVKDDAGTLYRLPSWRTDERGNITGSGTVHLPGTVTANELFSSESAWFGDPFQGTVPSSRIVEIYSQGESPSTATMIIAALLATAGLLAFVFAIALGASGGIM